ncbi:DUF2195 family protein [Pseudoalteromonas ruthenica]|uniref:DUF2195 family protein n=1 Tax=Pseudoalteromonas ruthenica TaxID=151081 RepID=UPI00110B0B68|nr:DUF2195 family protein [Pseudoalteromonas ruthenica]TMO44723.1 hypothetical protein CWC24_13355 [Pseudoalteromonas ruthenica]TMO50284.1 hypothetical protein CWC23_12380 [Pseudoalteromonas ruthenica]
MEVLKYSLFLLFLISNYSQATPHKKTIIRNNLSECITFSNYEVTYLDNIPMIKLHYQIMSSISECGCKSELSQYSSQLNIDGNRINLLTAKLVFKSEDITLPLATSNKLIDSYNLLVKFSCAPPS